MAPSSQQSTSFAPPGSVTVHTPAKLNLSLRILGKRDDGYHELESHFLAIGLYDTLTFARRHDEKVTLSVVGGGDDISSGQDNLVLKAARLLQESFGTQTGAEITLVKRIPSQAGLGGGSSDAAATLAGLADLWDLPATRDDLHRLAAQLGSDVNFFLADCLVGFATGRGEHVEPVPVVRPFSAVVLKPRFGASTASVFAHFENQGSIPADTGQQCKFVQSVLSGTLPGKNDLLPALLRSSREFHTWCNQLKSALRSQERGHRSNHASDEKPSAMLAQEATDSIPWSLTGSGTAVFKFVQSTTDARCLSHRVNATASSGKPLGDAWPVGPGRLHIIHT